MELIFKKMLVEGDSLGFNFLLDPLQVVSLNGVVTYWHNINSREKFFKYKLICACGGEYYFLANREWRRVLRNFLWQNV
ncbi:MAG: hypothetical protein KDD40_09445, partial [Bdellovibrionales bacterium]|nr:hypothetical protein [Bdellovibrionales bacterium]